MKPDRIQKVRKSLKGWKVDALLVTNPVDLHYLTGLELSAGTCVISKEAACLIVDGRYFEKCKKETSFKVERQAPLALSKTLSNRGFKACKRVGFAEDSTSYASYIRLKEAVIGELVPLSRPVEHIRAVKEGDELRAIERAARLVESGFEFLASRLRIGVTEKMLARELEIFWLQMGADKLAFESIIAFGKNSSMPHYRASNVALKPNDAVLVDIGAFVDGYAADMTRMFFFGKPDTRLAKIYDIVQEAQKKAIKGTKPGITASSLYNISKKVIDKAGHLEHYLHGLGHGIGLEVHEYPILKPENQNSLLLPGMCLTIEPGIYLPGVGGVRIEDMVVVTKEGHRELTGCPKARVILPII